MINNVIGGHGGDKRRLSRMSGRNPEEIIDYSANVNPDGMPEFLRAVIHRNIERIDAYPEAYSESAVEAASAFHGVPSDCVIFGNGSNQLIHMLPMALGFKRAGVIAPAFAEYGRSCEAAGVELQWFDSVIGNVMDAAFEPDIEAAASSLPSGSALFIGNPANPSGHAVKADMLIESARRHPEVRFIVDEAFAEFAAPEYSCLIGSGQTALNCLTQLEHEALASLNSGTESETLCRAALPDNIVVLRSLTKFYGMAGLRVGYAVASAADAALLRGSLPPWSVNTFAIEAAVEVFRSGGAFRESAKAENSLRRGHLVELLADVEGLSVFPSHTNYLLLRSAMPSAELTWRLLKDHGVAVRDCSNFHGLDSGGFIRVAVRTDVENERLADALSKVLAGRPSRRVRIRPRRKPSLMIQGLSSSAGKSVIAAAFCRILLQEGYRVAPFKAQNMALNSYVTLDGGEIGRAQAVQAEACRVEPDPRMNPILLKPNSDTGSQVILMGKVVSNMDVSSYFRFKKEAFETALEAYASLEAEYDAIVIEGAGSPAEVNLKSHDIVNMRMAREAGSPVLLVGDIDRGGVYGSFLGAMDTFDRWERDLVMGFIVNKFRGDASLLAPAHDYLLRFTGRPVLGVVPYLRDIGVPEEDMSIIPFDDIGGKDAARLDVALLVPRHVSNFTDFAPLAIEPDLAVRIVRSVKEFGNPDVVVIPGSKNVAGSLRGFRDDGLDDKIFEAAMRGAWIVGVCGGLQMCGTTVEDPHGIESATVSTPGLGLINLRTTLEADKILRRPNDVDGPFGMKVSGYEIHHGRTVAGEGVETIMTRGDGEPVGFATGKVWTTYLHGVFDDDLFRRRFIDSIRVSRGMGVGVQVRAVYSTEKSLNRLADAVRSSVDIAAILKRL